MKSQISIGGGGVAGGEGEKRERICRAGKSRGSIVCVYGVMHYKA